MPVIGASRVTVPTREPWKTRVAVAEDPPVRVGDPVARRRCGVAASTEPAVDGGPDGGAAAITTEWLVVAEGPPLRDMVWPVKTWVSEVPAASVTVKVTV